MTQQITDRANKFIAIVIWVFITGACTKSVSTTNPNVPTPVISSMVVTYPYSMGTTVRKLFYTFDRDSLSNIFTVHCKDSIQYRIDLYGLYMTTKTYYMSSGTPNRVIKISMRQTEKLQTTPATSGVNYDFVFDYNDNTLNPSHYSITTFNDALATSVANQQSGDVQQFEPRGSYWTGGIDVINCTYTEPTRLLLSGYQNLCCVMHQYTEGNYDVMNFSPHYATTLFYDPAYQGTYPNQSPSFWGLYIFDQSQLKTLAWDMFNYSSPSGIPYAQRKFDFKYDLPDPQLQSLFNITGVPETLIWEQSCLSATTLEQTYGWNGDYSYIDPYIPDPCIYYQDICSSYSDSTFSILPDSTKRVFLSATYTNNIIKDADGKITHITKTDDKGNIWRDVEPGYR
jgi:hypothetical protein